MGEKQRRIANSPAGLAILGFSIFFFVYIFVITDQPRLRPPGFLCSYTSAGLEAFGGNQHTSTKESGSQKT